jgi:hypothetical protein
MVTYTFDAERSTKNFLCIPTNRKEKRGLHTRGFNAKL